jgi:tetratricopeptide (TPR) repeat protein
MINLKLIKKMKKLITFFCAIVIGVSSYAQKNEIKDIEKALKSNNFAEAKALVQKAEALLPNMDDKLKDKFYYYKLQALHANGAISDTDVDTALATYEEFVAFDKAGGNAKNMEDATSIRTRIYESIVQSAYDASQTGDNALAGDKFHRAYTISPKDTIFLYAAASSYLNAQQYDKSLEYYQKLKDLGYKGVSTQYVATNKETGEEEVFSNKNLRDIGLKSGQYIAGKDKKLPSKQGEIYRFMALIYSSQDNSEKALELINEAKKYNPDDMQLVIAEAKAYLASGQKEKIKPLLESAGNLIKDDPVNLMNFGIFAMEISENEMAMKYFEDASRVNPKLSEPYLNIGALILDGDRPIVDEMNALGTSQKDNERYDVLKEKRLEIYTKAVPYIEKAFELKPDIETAQYLRDIYSAAFMTDKYKAMKEKIAEMEAGN